MYIDTLIRIKNGVQAQKDVVRVPFSNFDFAVAEALVNAGYLKSVSKKGRRFRRVIDIEPKYDAQGKARISGIKLISKPSRKMYVTNKDIKVSRQGYGSFFISTSKGILTNTEARKQKVGGELLFEIW